VNNSEEFQEWRKLRASELPFNEDYVSSSLAWLNEAVRSDYSYMFEWFGVPVIQFPSDLLLIQEAIYKARPNVIIEVGIARGGMTVFLASMLEMINRESKYSVVGVDIKISNHTKIAITNSPWVDRVTLIEGSSVENDTVLKVKNLLQESDRVMVILDSNHTSSHVFEEMQFFSGIVSNGSYLVVMDTAIEYIDESLISDRPWSRDNGPLTAVKRFMKSFPEMFVIDSELNSKSFPGAARDGFLRKRLGD